MSKTKLLTFAIIALFIINITTLSFFIFKGPKNGHNSPREIIIKKLDFDGNQIVAYDKIIKKHRGSIISIDREIIGLKNNLYKELSNPRKEKVVDSLFLEIGNNQSVIEKLHYNHFLEIKKLCKPEQLENYNLLTSELTRLFNPNNPKRPKHNEHHP